MTPGRHRLARHLTAGILAVAVAGLFVLGVDGLIGAMQKLSHLFATAPAPSPAAEPAAAEPAPTPGVVPAFIVPAEGKRE
ncbi:MAG: hypothetical protein IT486_04645 [Gammaproteobacteria bacterium]|nr:hypothetical protein [Gammaproteobacteria bacterium]